MAAEKIVYLTAAPGPSPPAITSLVFQNVSSQEDEPHQFRRFVETFRFVGPAVPDPVEQLGILALTTTGLLIMLGSLAHLAGRTLWRGLRAPELRQFLTRANNSIHRRRVEAAAAMAIRSGAAAMADPIEPRLSASTTDAPPWSSP